MIILDGKALALSLLNDIKEALSKPLVRKPCLVAVLSTDHPASLSYVQRKVRACKEVGIDSRVIHFTPQNTEHFLTLVDELNADSSVDGILLQLPIPFHIDLMQVLQRVDPSKDVDGFHPINVGKMMLGDQSAFYPCTPIGIKLLLQHYNIELMHKHVVVIGRSNIVGKPLACILMQNQAGCNATVTVAHRYTKNLKEITLTADVLISAVGKPNLIREDMVKPGVVIVDVGVNRIDDPSKKLGYRLVGDVAYDEVLHKVSAITPVPGGVGPMTIAMLLKNTLKGFYQHIE